MKVNKIGKIPERTWMINSENEKCNNAYGDEMVLMKIGWSTALQMDVVPMCNCDGCKMGYFDEEEWQNYE